MSTQEFLLPDLGEGLTESEVVEWRVGPGDTVTLNQVIAEVETAKALVEIPSPYAGVVARLHAEEGQVVEVGEPLVTFDLDVAGGGSAAGNGTGTGGASAAPASPAPREEPAGSDATSADSASILSATCSTPAPTSAATGKTSSLSPRRSEVSGLRSQGLRA